LQYEINTIQVTDFIVLYFLLMKNKIILALIILSMCSLCCEAQSTTYYPAMIKVKGGTFNMGGTERDEKPVHSVTVNDFSMCKYEITVAEYKAFCKATGRTMPKTPSWGLKDIYPIVNVNFTDAADYCNWLSKVTGKNYRLPTEAEWEFAARGGTKSSNYLYAGSDNFDEVGWNNSNAGDQAKAIGLKKPNELGLYDMSGNVMEWCKDWYNDSYYSVSPNINPQGAVSGSNLVLRGGSWYHSLSFCQVAFRSGYRPSDRYDSRGFRVVLTQQ
jgi:sulfatase modifying factor 1